MSMNESLLGAEAKAAPPSSAPYSIQAGGAPAVALRQITRLSGWRGESAALNSSGRSRLWTPPHSTT